MTPLSWLEPWFRTDDPSATISRVFRSKHVADLRWIVSLAIVAVILTAAVALLGSIESQVVNDWQDLRKAQGPWTAVRMLLAAGGSFLTFILPILAALGVLVAWAYQVASKRLGVVDLFACEIGTICRIGTVLDTVHTIVDRFEHGPPVVRKGNGDDSPAERPFVSQENYFPIFDGNSSDLQALEAKVVIHITGFYTYMKALRDTMRTLAGIRPEPADYAMAGANSVPTGPWHEAARNVVYLWLLGLESARHALRELVEFEPEQAEVIMVILLSELEAYRFLRRQFVDPRDVHTGRIKMREKEYAGEVNSLRELVRAGRAADQAQGKLDWRPSEILLPELDLRFEAASKDLPLRRPERAAALPTRHDAHEPAPGPVMVPGGFSMPAP